jgi:glycosyltransferase involved in cell wall biosynthesis
MMTQISVANPVVQRMPQQAVADSEVQLLIPDNDVEDPEISIVIPAMNEAITISDFIAWCKEGLAKAGVVGEILIVDSSTDDTPQRALAGGARVLKTPKRGLGRAYIEAIPYIRGKYVLMGDADCTYDFREIAGFVEKFRDGYEFIMGSRFKGYIEPHAMPALHRYFGTPLITMILNMMYQSKFSDINCGMRGMTLDALKRIALQSSSWEYASEMVLKASLLGLRTTEVPIKFYKDREGRASHLKRGGWFTPWRAGWMNLKVMFLFAPDFFLFWPSLILMALGLSLVLCLTQGPCTVAGLGLDLHAMLLGLTLSTLGYGGFHLAVLAKAYYNFRPAVTARITRIFTYNRGLLVGGLMIIGGVVLGLAMAIQWMGSGLQNEYFSHYGVFGLLLIILGFQTITHTLIFQMILFSCRSKGGWR